MRIVIIGGSGHVGTYLVPKLVEAGHQVINVTRGKKTPFQPNQAWSEVQQVIIDRDAEESAGNFGGKIRDLHGDVVIDMICFTLESCQQLVQALDGGLLHFIYCGSNWVYGHYAQVPVTENTPRRPFGQYGIRKAEIEAYLLGEYQRNGFPSTSLLPGHMVGRGWRPINPAGNLNPIVFKKLAFGEELALPNFGLETLHHVHCDDVAQAFMLVLENWNNAVGQSFNVVSPSAVNLRGYAETVANWFGEEARLKFMPFDEWSTTVNEEDAGTTLEHILHSSNCSIEKAQRLLGYKPRYNSYQAIHEALAWMLENKLITHQDGKTISFWK
jgi:nucleoside-diphosphate-sugar epimerase